MTRSMKSQYMKSLDGYIYIYMTIYHIDMLIHKYIYILALTLRLRSLKTKKNKVKRQL